MLWTVYSFCWSLSSLIVWSQQLFIVHFYISVSDWLFSLGGVLWRPQCSRVCSTWTGNVRGVYIFVPNADRVLTLSYVIACDGRQIWGLFQCLCSEGFNKTEHWKQPATMWVVHFGRMEPFYVFQRKRCMKNIICWNVFLVLQHVTEWNKMYGW